jgi:hypothetical protein
VSNSAKLIQVQFRYLVQKGGRRRRGCGIQVGEGDSVCAKGGDEEAVGEEDVGFSAEDGGGGAREGVWVGSEMGRERR